MHKEFFENKKKIIELSKNTKKWNSDLHKKKTIFECTSKIVFSMDTNLKSFAKNLSFNVSIYSFAI